MKIGRHGLFYLINAEKAKEKQLEILDIALSEFSKKYEMHPECSVAVKLKTERELEFHPLINEGRARFNLKENGFEIKFSGSGLAIPDATVLKTTNYEYHVYYTSKYLEKGFI